MLGEWKALPQAQSTCSPIYTQPTNPNGQGGCYTVKNNSNLNVQVFKFQMASCYCHGLEARSQLQCYRAMWKTTGTCILQDSFQRLDTTVSMTIPWVTRKSTVSYFFV